MADCGALEKMHHLNGRWAQTCAFPGPIHRATRFAPRRLLSDTSLAAMGKVHGSLARAGKVKNQTPKAGLLEVAVAIHDVNGKYVCSFLGWEACCLDETQTRKMYENVVSHYDIGRRHWEQKPCHGTLDRKWSKDTIHRGTISAESEWFFFRIENWCVRAGRWPKLRRRRNSPVVPRSVSCTTDASSLGSAVVCWSHLRGNGNGLNFCFPQELSSWANNGQHGFSKVFGWSLSFSTLRSR